MRIFLISNMYPSDTDPLFGVFVKNFKEELEKQGVSFPKEALIRGKSKSRFKKILNYTAHYSRILAKYLTFKYDIIYLHYLSHHIPVLFFLTIFNKKPLIINVHGTDVISLRPKSFLNTLAKYILGKTNLVIVPTSYFKQVMLERYPFLKEKEIFISPSGGIDGTRFYKKKNLQKNKIFTLGLISRFIKEKGWQTFMDALIILKNKGVHFKALIAGKGPDKDAILNYIESNDLQKEVEFLGLVKQSELVHIYNQLDLYIFPTYREAESLGLTGLEAMSCGVPVVACDIAGPSTYIIHSVNGFLFEIKNCEELAQIIIDYMSLNDAQKKKFKEAAIIKAGEYEKTRVAHLLNEKLDVLLQDKLF